jgi:hypothetical protein
MKKLLIIVLSFSLLAACRYRRGSGNIVTEKRTTSSFTSLSAGGGFEVEIKNGPTEVVVESDDNIIKDIETTVVNGELRIRLDHMNLSDAHLKVFVTAPEINGIKASAASNITAKDILKSSGIIHLQSSSGSDIEAALDAPEVDADASGGGEMKLSGKTRNMKAVSSSGSTIEAKELLSENTEARASSGATIKVHASLSLDASASSGGNIGWRGGATNVKKNVSSGGEIDRE